MTPAEATMWKLLRNRQLAGYKFRRQHSIGSYIADFYCHEKKLVIELDGSVHDDVIQGQYDLSRDEWMKEGDIEVLRFKNSELKNDPESVLEAIKARWRKGNWCQSAD